MKPVPQSRLEKRLSALLAQASHDFGLLEPNDHVMVCVSGGKDSLSLLHLLRRIQRRAPFPFTTIAVHLDQRQPGYPEGLLERFFEAEGYEHRIVREDTYSIVKDRIPAGKTYCSLCSRLRRGVLYNLAVELGATKIALGHHRDDVIETLLLNAFLPGSCAPCRHDSGPTTAATWSFVRWSTAPKRISLRLPRSSGSPSFRAGSVGRSPTPSVNK